MELTETERAYLAGLFDGEGCIYISKRGGRNTPTPEYTLRLTIAQTDGYLLQFWRDRVDLGSIVYQKRQLPRHGCYAWMIPAAQAEKFIDLVLPYLHTKRPQADIAMTFRETFVFQGPERVPEQIIQMREQCRILLGKAKGLRFGGPIITGNSHDH